MKSDRENNTNESKKSKEEMLRDGEGKQENSEQVPGEVTKRRRD